MAVSMIPDETNEIEDPVNAHCALCPGTGFWLGDLKCFKENRRPRACFVPEDPGHTNGAVLRPPMGVAPLAPDPYELTTEAIRAAYIEGKSLSEISKDLNARGVPTKHRKTWCPATVRGIILRLPRAFRKERDA
jgi:hypothetical protein